MRARPKSATFASAAGEENVARLEVAVDDPEPVRCVDRRGDAGEQRRPPRRAKRAVARQPLGERAALAELHGEVRLVGLGAAEVEDGDDVRMDQRAGGARLAPETLEGDRPGKELRRQDLDRDRAVHLLVSGAVDDPGAALADPLEQAIAAVEEAPEARIARGHRERVSDCPRRA